MRQYEHWANMLYPKMTFIDVTNRIEALARKREFKVRLVNQRVHQICEVSVYVISASNTKSYVHAVKAFNNGYIGDSWYIQ